MLVRISMICMVLLLVSCDITKQATKGKTDRQLIESYETITHRQGDTVFYEIPSVHFKDTTIYRKNYQTGTTQVVKYDKEGNIDLQCISGLIEEIQRSNRNLVEAILTKQSEKEENFDSSVIIYAFVGLGVLILMVGAGFIYAFRKQTKTVEAVLQQIIK